MENNKDYQAAVMKEIEDLPEETLPNLLQIIKLYKESLFQQRRMYTEFQEELKEWDKLSDEALANFEEEL